MIKFFKNSYLTTRLLLVLIGLVVLFILGFPYTFIYSVAKILLYCLFTVIIIDILLLFVKNGIDAKRITHDKLSNGDINHVTIEITNTYKLKLHLEIIDEVPQQFQLRDKTFTTSILPNSRKKLEYTLRPIERGEYEFGNINIYVTTALGLIQKRYTINQSMTIGVYPSFIQLKKYELMAFSNRLDQIGVKKIRNIGQNREFEQIKEYTFGDDFRTVNWKATARRSQLMVNQYEDEKSQQIISLIDKGRSMKMPFDGLSLVDYAINASLVLSSVSIHKQDKAGLITFSNVIGNIVPPGNKSSHMNLILETLYKQQTRYQESDYGRLYRNIKWNIKRRSLLFLYTNFESVVGMKRQLRYLRSIAKDHLLVVIFFQNSELNRKIDAEATSIEQIYEKTLAEKYRQDKELISRELNKYGIQTILTEPQNLTVNAINKYLEMKSRGLI